jgi:hypothetical protein
MSLNCSQNLFVACFEAMVWTFLFLPAGQAPMRILRVLALGFPECRPKWSASPGLGTGTLWVEPTRLEPKLWYRRRALCFRIEVESISAGSGSLLYYIGLFCRCHMRKYFECRIRSNYAKISSQLETSWLIYCIGNRIQGCTV